MNSDLEKHLRQELEVTTKQLEWKTKELNELKKKLEVTTNYKFLSYCTSRIC
jgi:hypothetical protein